MLALCSTEVLTLGMRLDELSIIYCEINYNFFENGLLANRKMADKILEQVMKKIRSYGISCEAIELQGIGGGGGETLYELVSRLWGEGERLTIILSLLTEARWALRSYFSALVEGSKVSFTVHLKLEKQHSTEEKERSVDIKIKLRDLKNLSQDIHIWLSNKYKNFKFDQNFSILNKPENYNISFLQTSNYVNSFNNWRILRQIKHLNIQENYRQEISFTKGIFVMHSVTVLEHDEINDVGWGYSRYNKIYFKIFSSKLFTKFPTADGTKLKRVTNRIRYKLKIRTRLKSLLKKLNRL